MKRHRKEAAEYVEEGVFQLFLEWAVDSVVRRASARKYFEDVGWMVDDTVDDVDYCTLS
jgi:hypothetical protein